MWVCEARSTSGFAPPKPSTLFLETVSHRDLGSPIRLFRLTSNPQPISTTLVLVLWTMLHHAWFSHGCWGSNSGPHAHMEALSTEQARRLSGCSMSGWSSKWVCIADTGMARSRVRASGPGEISKTSEHRFPSSGMFTAWDCSTYRDLQQRLANSSPVPYRITLMRFWVVERNRCSPSETAQAPDPSFPVFPCCLLSQVKSQ